MLYSKIVIIKKYLFLGLVHFWSNFTGTCNIDFLGIVRAAEGLVKTE